MGAAEKHFTLRHSYGKSRLVHGNDRYALSQAMSMRLICPTSPSECIPVSVGLGPCEKGPRLGGRIPSGVTPKVLSKFTRYFLTIPLSVEPPLEASIFLNFDFDEMLKASGKLGSPGLVEVITHEESHRGADTDWSSPLSEHPLVLHEPKADSMIDYLGETVAESCHKIGGTPYWVHPKAALFNEVNRMMSSGFLQILQIDFPGNKGDLGIVAGDWPFGDGMFHLLGKPPFGSRDWGWFWEL